ncbi:MAG: lipoyl(octanoyl) transferase LipB [Terriglobales bacterium]
MASRTGTESQGLTIVELGRLRYAETEALQTALARQREAGAIGDLLLLLEHEPVITLGRNASVANVLATPEVLAGRGVELAECNRGGDVTWHGPGQLVGYPILDLRACRRPAFLPPRTGRLELGPVDYVRALEEVLIGAAGDCGIACRRLPGLTGVWTTAEPARKLAAIGVHVARGITTHGFALNVASALEGFELIVPCGLAGRGVTSIARETAAPPTLAAVRALVSRRFAEVFDRHPDSWDHRRLQQFLMQQGEQAWPSMS